MDLGNRLLELRKHSGMSQEEVAEKLNVSRQTVSKWETGLSTPDFDKIAPLCNLYGISTNELLGITFVAKESEDKTRSNKLKKTIGLVGGIFLYFLALIEIIVLSDYVPDEFVIGGFFLIIAVATCLIIFSSIMYSHTKTEKVVVERHGEIKKQLTFEEKRFKAIEKIISTIVLVIYLFVSFTTMAWHITWIIWIIYVLIMEIVKLIFLLNGKEVDNDEED